MSEVYTPTEQIEIIDNEHINESLNKLENNSDSTLEQKEATLLLNKIEKQIQWIDIDLAYDRITQTYKFIATPNNGEAQVLNIALTAQQLESSWEIIQKLLTLEDIYIEWDKFSRYIKHNSSLLPSWFDDDIISIDNTAFSQEEKEEFFKFAMNVKWIAIQDWDISGPMIHGEQNQKYYEQFWNKADQLTTQAYEQYNQGMSKETILASGSNVLSTTQELAKRMQLPQDAQDSLRNFILEHRSEYKNIQAGKIIKINAYKDKIDLIVDTKKETIQVSSLFHSQIQWEKIRSGRE